MSSAWTLQQHPRCPTVPWMSRVPILPRKKIARKAPKPRTRSGAVLPCVPRGTLPLCLRACIAWHVRLVHEFKDLGIAVSYTDHSRRQLGVYAMRNFQAGECIVAEEPSISLSKQTQANSAYLTAKMIQQKPAFAALLFPRALEGFQPSKPLRFQDEHIAIIKKLLPKASDTEILHAYYRVRYNEFNPDFGHSGGIYALLSLFNHSCSPPAMFTPIPQKTGLKIMATEPIKNGQEITIPYCLIYLSTAEQRQAALEFSCACPLCTSGTTTGMPDAQYGKVFLREFFAAPGQDRYPDLKTAVPVLLQRLEHNSTADESEVMVIQKRTRGMTTYATRGFSIPTANNPYPEQQPEDRGDHKQ